MNDRQGVRKIRTALIRGISACALLPVLAAVVLFSSCGNAVPSADEDEIKVNIRLDLGEDIGLLLIGYDVGGSEGGEGSPTRTDPC